jgi:tRNA dimethylallyltransferase
MAEKIKVVAVVGPTGSGKTGLSIELAKAFGGEIICADSMQIYKGFPIASAAPTAEEKGNIPHHLFEFLEPETAFSVSDYVKLAKDKINEVASRGKLPIIVGGTGLYIDSLINNIEFSGEEDNSAVRDSLVKDAESVGYAEMLERLRKIDPVAAEKLHENDKKRIIRGLEIFALHKITPTEMNARSKEVPSPYDCLYIGTVCENRENLYTRIETRVDKMVEAGLIEEIKASRERLGTTSGQAIGHKELYPYLDGEISLDEALQNMKTSTRRYAKRQLTWFRRNEAINWLFVDSEEDIFKKANALVSRHLKELEKGSKYNLQ